MKKKTKQEIENLDYHEGLSWNQCKIILREFNLESKQNEFFEWLDGQTSPSIIRYDWKGKERLEIGVYEWDLFRWIENQTRGTKLIWD